MPEQESADQVFSFGTDGEFLPVELAEGMKESHLRHMIKTAHSLLARDHDMQLESGEGEEKIHIHLPVVDKKVVLGAAAVAAVAGLSVAAILRARISPKAKPKA